MDRSSIYYKQVQFLMQVLPFVARRHCFALKGGTAINLFGRNTRLRLMPVLLCQIDHKYSFPEVAGIMMSPLGVILGLT